MSEELKQAAQRLFKAYDEGDSYAVDSAISELRALTTSQPAQAGTDRACGVMSLIEDYAKAVHDGDDALCQVLLRTIEASLPTQPAAQATQQAAGEPTEGEFFAFDPEGGQAFYKTQQEAIDHANESLKYYRDGANDHGEWDEDVEQIRWGVVMQRVKATNISATEDGESSCDYELQDVATHPAPGVPEGFALVKSPITEAMHEAACKVLTRSTGMDGLPQRMLDALAAAQAKGGV